MIVLMRPHSSMEPDRLPGTSYHGSSRIADIYPPTSFTGTSVVTAKASLRVVLRSAGSSYLGRLVISVHGI